MDNQSLGIKDNSSIVEKTVLVRVSFGVLGNTKKVSSRIVSASVEAHLLRIQKSLVESPELEAIVSADKKMRGILGAMCVPYDMGLLLLPRVSVESARDKFIAYRDVRAELVHIFASAYPSRIDASREKCIALASELGIEFDLLWNPKDYISPEYVTSKFYFSWDFLSLTVPEELKQSGKYAEANKEFQAKLNNVSEEITLVMRESLLELVTTLKESLEPSADGKKRRIHTSNVTNIQAFLDSFQARNITNDSDLNAVAEELKALIHPDFSVDVLKKDESFKSQIHTSMASISQELVKLVETVPGRKFRGIVQDAAASTVAPVALALIPSEAFVASLMDTIEV